MYREVVKVVLKQELDASVVLEVEVAAEMRVPGRALSPINPVACLLQRSVSQDQSVAIRLMDTGARDLNDDVLTTSGDGRQSHTDQVSALWLAVDRADGDRSSNGSERELLVIRHADVGSSIQACPEYRRGWCCLILKAGEECCAEEDVQRGRLIAGAWQDEEVLRVRFIRLERILRQSLGLARWALLADLGLLHLQLLLLAGELGLSGLDPVNEAVAKVHVTALLAMLLLLPLTAGAAVLAALARWARS
eukprot:295877-Rhodomonas_salina.2